MGENTLSFINLSCDDYLIVASIQGFIDIIPPGLFHKLIFAFYVAAMGKTDTVIDHAKAILHTMAAIKERVLSIFRHVNYLDSEIHNSLQIWKAFQEQVIPSIDFSALKTIETGIQLDEFGTFDDNDISQSVSEYLIPYDASKCRYLNISIEMEDTSLNM